MPPLVIRPPMVSQSEFDAAILALGGGPQGTGQYVHTQNTPAEIWVIPHSLGKFPQVFLEDSAHNDFVAPITHLDTNNLEVHVGFPIGGRAICG